MLQLSVCDMFTGGQLLLSQGLSFAATQGDRAIPPPDDRSPRINMLAVVAVSQQLRVLAVLATTEH